MPTFVLEIGTEEIPAAFLASCGRELGQRFTQALADAGLDHGEISVMTTPRRAAVMVRDVAPRQKLLEELVTGPAVAVAYDGEGKPTRALAGFLASQGAAEGELERVSKGRGEYVALRRQRGGESAATVLARMAPEIISALPFPKRMRWGSHEVAYARPLRWILALLDGDVVPFAVGPLQSGRETFGHRVHGRGPFSVPEAAAYAGTVAAQGGVTLSPAERRSRIVSAGDALAVARGGRVLWKESLLDEVQGLVEHPVPLIGDFDPAYLEIPREVLLTSMESHQKSFGLEDEEGRLMPHFLTVLNLSPRDEDLVRRGWERVLRARLEDARFFWRSDLAATFDDWLERLDAVIFIGQLGSMGEKSRRLEKLCRWICERVPECQGLAGAAARAGRLAKADLVSGMVGEFDSLQGVMGGIYAAEKGEDPLVAQALREQYLPAGPDTPVPASLTGAILSLADKADTLAGCFGLGMTPTGAADPNGLRRCALGIIRILLDRDLQLDVRELFEEALHLYGQRSWKLSQRDTIAALMEFFAGRLRHYFLGMGYDARLVDAALNAGVRNVPQCAGRLAALADFSKSEGYAEAVRTFKRMANILRQSDEASLEDGWSVDLFEAQEELDLGAVLEKLLPRLDARLAAGDYASILTELRDLRPTVDAFFENVMIMADDAAVRANRLAMLGQLGRRFAKVADFAALQI